MIKSFFNIRAQLVSGIQRIQGIGAPGVGFIIEPGGQFPLGYYPFYAYVDGDRGNRYLVNSDRPVWVDAGFKFLEFDYIFTGGRGATKPTRSGTTGILNSTWDIHILGARGDALGAPARARRALCDILPAPSANNIGTTQPSAIEDGWEIGPNWKAIHFKFSVSGGTTGASSIQVWFDQGLLNDGSSGTWTLSESIADADFVDATTSQALTITREIRIPGNAANRLITAEGGTYLESPRIGFSATGATVTLAMLLAEVEF